MLPGYIIGVGDMRYDLDHSLGPMYVGPIRDR